MDKPTLQTLVGQQIRALIPILQSTPTDIIIRGVEVGGIWIEHDRTTQKIMRDLGQAVSEETALLFVPYSGIGYLLGWMEKIALSESKLGG
jgi:hypothetical protein